LYPNNLLYWDTMLYAIKKGCRYFDFGRSTIDSGTYTFKIRWGATASPLHWQIIELKKYRNFGHDNQSAKFKLAMAMWKKMPVSCSRIIGPVIRKNITA